MIDKTYVVSDGVSRRVTGKQYGDEMRIYRIYGDITNTDALKEMAEVIAIEFKVSRVVYQGVNS